jgi:hypothetical protein
MMSQTEHSYVVEVIIHSRSNLHKARLRGESIGGIYLIQSNLIVTTFTKSLPLILIIISLEQSSPRSPIRPPSPQLIDNHTLPHQLLARKLPFITIKPHRSALRLMYSHHP